MNPDTIEDFYGVYLLYSVNPKYKGRTYVGYTRDPNRRIKQHNRGTWAGGAWKTSYRGPWKMVLIVHGFPNNISALRFEWAWQNPNKTTRLQHMNLKKVPRKESEFQFKLRIMSEMLHVGPWSRLPLTIQWLEDDFFKEYTIPKLPPEHIKTCNGLVKVKNPKKILFQDINQECLICSKTVTNTKSLVSCLNEKCELKAHLSCLADIFLKPGDYVPINGTCPFCGTLLKWGDLIKKLNGCGTSNAVEEDSASSDDCD